MKITLENFEDFISGSFDYDRETEAHTGLRLYNENADIGGGRITVADIDRLKQYPNAETVTVTGLHQDTFEYFIKTYGHRLRAIRFFKNKMVEDWSLLGTLPELEFVAFFANQRITSLWDMSQNHALKGLSVEDFTRLHSIAGIEKAPALRYFNIGDRGVWGNMRVDTLRPLSSTDIETLTFWGQKIEDNDITFLSGMKHLKKFDFATNLFTTEQVAWIVANFPLVEGFALRSHIDTETFDAKTGEHGVPGKLIIGKRKPILPIEGNEARIQKYIDRFETLVKSYRGTPHP